MGQTAMVLERPSSRELCSLSLQREPLNTADKVGFHRGIVTLKNCRSTNHSSVVTDGTKPTGLNFFDQNTTVILRDLVKGRGARPLEKVQSNRI